MDDTTQLRGTLANIADGRGPAQQMAQAALARSDSIQYRSDSPAEPTRPVPSEYDERLAQIRAEAAARRPVLCGQPTKQWDQYNRAPCTLYAGHKGYHSISTFNCDECGQQRRNPPAGHVTSYPYDEVVAVVCFICQAKSRSRGWHP